MNNFQHFKRLRTYEFNDKYIKYLHSFDGKVHFPENVIYVTSVKYVGSIAANEKAEYFAPMTSDKNKIYEHKIENNTFEKIMTPGTFKHNSCYVGTLLICNQIPIISANKQKNLFSIDPYAQKNKQYGNLLALELQWLNKYRDDIYRKSQNCLHNKITYEEKMHCCNFKLLEHAAIVYDENNELIKERIVMYPKIFSEKENKTFFEKIRQSIEQK